MISEIRSYIKGIIQGVDSDLKENPSAFYKGDLGENIIDRSYQITIQAPRNILRTDFREYQIPVTVTFFGFGGTEEIENYDELLEKVICVNDQLMDLKNIHQFGKLTNTIDNGINITQIAGSEDGFKMDINLTLTLAYIREE